MIKAVFFDIDGTLFSHTSHKVPESAITALQILKDRGIKIFTATGRGIEELYEINVDGIPFDGYVTLNGQMCLDRGKKMICSNAFSPEDTKVLTELFESKTVPVYFTEPENSYVNYYSDEYDIIVRSACLPRQPLGIYSGGSLLAVTVFNADVPSMPFVAKLRQSRVSQWHKSAYDIMPLNGGKAFGIRQLINFFGIREDEIALFGDADNDLEMLTMRGLGIAMGNAEESIKEKADLVTDDINSDGIYNAVVKYILPRMEP